MDVYVLDDNFDVIDVIDGYISCIWDIRGFTISEFELTLRASRANIDLLQYGRYLVRDVDMTEDRYDNVMIVCNIKITTDIDNGDTLIVSGYDLRYLLKRRVIAEQTTISGQIPYVITQLMRDAVIDPYDADRKISKIVIGSLESDTTVVDYQLFGEPLHEVISNLCESNDVVWQMYYRLTDRKIVLTTVKTYDKSSTVIFSDEFDNLLSSEYTFTSNAFKNCFIVAGEGDGSAQKKQTFVYGGSGLYRYEGFIDAKSLSSNNGEISSAEYNKLLQSEATKQLKLSRASKTLEGEADITNSYQYGVDFNLGDTVSVGNAYGISTTAKVISILECVDSNGMSIIPTFKTREVS